MSELLDFKGKVDFTQAKKDLADFEKMLAKAGISPAVGGLNKQFDSKPLTEYQKEVLKIKQQAVEDNKQRLAQIDSERKAKQEQVAADKAASLATQTALKEEARLKREQIQLQKQAAIEVSKRKPAEISNSQAEVDAYNNVVNGSKKVTSTLNEQNLAQNSVASSAAASVPVMKEVDAVAKSSNLTKQQTAKLIAEEKFIQQQATAELKNHAREMLNAKGSLEQRRAALIRLTNVYDKLSIAERNTASGGRLKSIVIGLGTQVKTLEADTLRAQRNVGNYGGAIGKVWGGLKTIANILPGVGLAGLLAFAVEPLFEYIKGLDFFKKKIDEIVLSRKMLSDTNTKGAKDAQVEIVQLKSLYKASQDTNLSMKQRNSYVDEIQKKYPSYFGNISNETILAGGAAGAYDKLSKSIVATAKARASEAKIAENSSRQLDNDQAIAEAEIEYNKQAAIIERARDKQRQEGSESARFYADESARAEKRQAEAAKTIRNAKSDSLILSKRSLALEKNITDQISKGADLTSPVKIKDTTRAQENAIKQRNELQFKIDEITRKSVRTQQTADDAEVESVRDKYVKIRQEIDAFNAKNKGKLKVDSSGLAVSEKGEVQAVIDKQSNERFKAQLADQLKDFEEFENYKLKFGLDAAQKRYNTEYTTAEAFAQKLEDLQTGILDKYGDPSGYTEAQKQELSIVTDQIVAFAEKRKSIDDDMYARAYQAAMTAQQALLQIEADYHQDVKALGSQATDEQIANLDRRKREAIRNVNEEYSDRKAKYADLMENLDAMTRSKAIEALEEAKKSYTEDYQNKLITARQFADKIAAINNTIDSLNGNNIFKGINNAIKRYKEAKEAFDKASNSDPADKKDKAVAVLDARAKMFDKIGEGAEAASVGIAGVADVFDQLGIGGEKLQGVMKGVSGVIGGAGEIAAGFASGNPVAIVSGSIKLLSSAIDLFNGKDRKLNRKIEVYKEQLASLGKAYAKLERDVNNSVGDSYYSDSAAQIENLKRQQEQLIKAREAESQKKKSDKGKIDEYNSAIDEIPNKIEDIQAAISQNLIQGTFKELSTSLADALTSAFQAGEDGIAAMDKTLDAFIANAIKGGLRIALLEKPIKQFTDELAAYAKANNNSVIGFDFDKYKEELKKAGNLFNDALEGSKEFFEDVDSTNTGSSLQKGITQITTDQASALEGIMRGQYEQQKKLVISSGQTVSQLTTIGKSIGDLFQIARNNFEVTVRIEKNTADTVVELKNAVTELKGINKNTGNSGNSYRGAGFG